MPSSLRPFFKRRFRRFGIALGWLILESVAPIKAIAAEEVAIGSRVELFADDYLVAKLNGDARLVPQVAVDGPQAEEVAQIVSALSVKGCLFYRFQQ